MTINKVAAIGLGSMGYGMAQSLIRAGIATYGYDVVPAQMERLQSEGGKAAPLAEIAPELDAVVVVLNAAQTESVLFGEAGIVPLLNKGAVVMACATVAPDFAREMEARCAEHGVLYVDAPISGGSVKAANQLLAGVHIATMGEAIAFGVTQGIEPQTFIDVISKCAGTSWMLENRAPHIAAGDYTPHSAIDIWLKDLGIVFDIAKGAKFGAPITAAALQQYVAASGSDLGREDDSAVAKALGVSKLDVSAEIAPGVSWSFCETVGQKIALTLKSGNFGNEGFFSDALTKLKELEGK